MYHQIHDFSQQQVLKVFQSFIVKLLKKSQTPQGGHVSNKYELYLELYLLAYVRKKGQEQHIIWQLVIFS